MATSIIHVNRHMIAANAADGGNRPIFVVKQRSKTIYCRGVLIKGPSEFVYDGSMLKCGARVWLTTESELRLTDPMDFQAAKNCGYR